MEAGFRAAGEVALTEQFDNHDGYRPRASAALAGAVRTFVPAAGGAAVTVEFGADGSAAWRRGEASGTASYEALELRADALALAVRLDPDRSVFAVLVGERGIAAVTTLARDGSGGADERTEYVQFGVDGPPGAPFESTADLVGKRIQWRYSSTHSFEHIYLNPSAYCWHCIEGPERWIGDVDPCVHHAIAPGLYLFAWSETVVPFNGAVAIDLDSMTSAGRFFGWDTERAEPGQIVVGARGTLLNETAYVPAR
ncbi:MAG: hypothetical protein JSU06_01615 [Actinobacteria bacterium]|nr:hypothetical protein [Actinomycetota bacterium]